MARILLIILAFLLPVSGLAQSRGEFRLAAAEALQAGDHALARELAVALLHSAGSAGERQLAYADLDEIDAKNPWNFKLFGAALPSTNINGAATARWLVTPMGRLRIEEGGAARSGIGYRIGAEAGYRAVVGPGLRLTPALRLTRIAYPELPRLDRWIAEPSLRLSRELPQLTLSARAYLRRTAYDDGSQSERAPGLDLALTRFQSGRLSYDFSVGREWIDRAPQDYLDGTLSHLGAGVNYALDARSDLAFGLRLEERRARGVHNGYRGARLWARGSHRLGAVDLFDLSLAVEERRHAAQVPGLGVLRRDQVYEIGAGWTNGRIRLFGAAPRIGCSYSETRSNIALYGTRATNCALGFVAAF